VPLAPEEGVDVPLAEPLHGGRQLALEGESAHLAVRDDLEPGVLLELEHLVHGAVLDALELCPGQLARLEALARLEQRRRTQEASDDVGSGCEHAGSVCLPVAFPARRFRL
jgi:hypothetical protein